MGSVLEKMLPMRTWHYLGFQSINSRRVELLGYVTAEKDL